MARLLSLLTFSSLAILLASVQTPVGAVTIHSHNARTPHHDALAKRVLNKKAKRCKPRPAPSAVATSSAAPASSTPAPTEAPASSPASSQDAKPSSTKESSSAKPAPSQSSGASAPSGGVFGLFPNKRMLAWGDDPRNLVKGWNSLAQRGYNWQPTTNNDVAQFGVKWCPMLWGSDDSDVTNFRNKVLNSDADVDCALGFNEPELPASAKQSNVDPQTAARLWIDNLVALKNKKGALLGTPAVTSDQTAAEQWLDSFFDACKDETGDAHCKADFMALHFYDTSVDNFKKFLTSMHDRYGLPVVVTEFGDHSFVGGAQPSAGQVFDFAGQMKSFFESTSWIAGYAPFGAIVNLPDIGEANRIMDFNNNPTSLAYTYYN